MRRQLGLRDNPCRLKELLHCLFGHESGNLVGFNLDVFSGVERIAVRLFDQPLGFAPHL
ncbi:MAG: hypothetical protein AAB225_07025 [Acidobacteriota bacterium]